MMIITHPYELALIGANEDISPDYPTPLAWRIRTVAFARSRESCLYGERTNHKFPLP
jgi:hypothetical protein